MKVFIGSSREKIDIALMIAEILEKEKIEVVMWDSTDIFRLGRTTWDELRIIAKEVDAAIFVFGKDDKTWWRKQEVDSVRDNVILEYGMFSGYLPKENVIFVTEDGVKIPSDLFGITYGVTERENTLRRKIKKWATAVNKDVPMNDPCFRVTSLSDAFSEALQTSKEIDVLRFFAISSFKSVQILRSYGEGLHITQAKVMLRKFEKDDFFYDKDIENAVNMAKNSWKELKKRENIKKLELREFVYHPDEGYYLFDDKYLIVGILNYSPKKKKVKYDFDSNVLLIKNESKDSKKWIDLYIKRFDMAFSQLTVKK